LFHSTIKKLPFFLGVYFKLFIIQNPLPLALEVKKEVGKEFI